MKQLRQIILDTETTGLSTEDGHRIIEIAGVEMIDRQLTSRYFHRYVQPHRSVDPAALKVHGITDEFLSSQPSFIEIIDDLLAYIDGADLIIHNAPFDVGFLNYEFNLIQGRVLQPIHEQCRIIDTLVLARSKHPGQRNSLDALCKRYQINHTHRTLHGALLDAELLALVYLAMTGGQLGLFHHQSGGGLEVNALETREIVRVDRTHIPHLKVIRSS